MLGIVSVMALVLLAGFPLALLVQAGADWLGHRIEDAWPGSSWAVGVGFWIRPLAPLAFSLVLLMLIIRLIVGR